MSTYRNGLIHGAGMLDSVINTFTYSKYPDEHHFPYYGYLGPGSRLDIRLDENLNPKPGEEPINDLDRTALKHDIAYQKIQDQYKVDKNKQKAIALVRKAGDEFIREASQSNVQPLGKVSAGLIKAKELGEKTGLISTKTFSGLGVRFRTKDGKEVAFVKKHDPTARLKQLAKITAPTPKKKMEGGLHPVLIPILASLAGTALGKVWDLVKEKISGKGISLDDNLYKTDSQKRKLIRHVLY